MNDLADFERVPMMEKYYHCAKQCFVKRNCKCGGNSINAFKFIKRVEDLPIFIYTKICVCKKDLKNFKIYLLYYNKCDNCILLDEEKSKSSFMCSFCNLLNQLDFNTICDKYTVRLLKNAAIYRQIEKKINEILQINLMKLKIQEF